MSYSTIQKNLERLIKENGLQIATLEKRAGLKKNNIYNILKGITKRPSARVLQAIADVFDTTVKDLCSQEDELITLSENDDLKLLSSICNNVIKLIQQQSYNFQYNEITSIINEVFEYSKYNSLLTPDKNYIKWLLKQKSETSSALLDEV